MKLRPAGAYFHETISNGPLHQLGRRAKVEFLQNPISVKFRGAFVEPKGAGNLRVRVAGAKSRQKFKLAPRQDLKKCAWGRSKRTQGIAH